MKKIILFIFLFVFVLSAGQSIAKNENAAPTKSPRIVQMDAPQVVNLKTRANKEIDKRITALNTLITKINGMKKLNADQKTLFQNKIQTEIDSLNALKTKIEGDTDLPTLKADAKSIVQSYRVYALFVPQVNILTAADKILNISDNELASISANLENRINEAKANGYDVSTLTALLAEIQSLIADAKTQAQSARDTIVSLSPDGYPGNIKLVQSARNMTQTAHKDLVTVNQDFRKIIQGLKLYTKKSRSSKTTPTVTVPPTASPTATATPTLTATP